MTHIPVDRFGARFGTAWYAGPAGLPDIIEENGGVAYLGYYTTGSEATIFRVTRSESAGVTTTVYEVAVGPWSARATLSYAPISQGAPGGEA